MFLQSRERRTALEAKQINFNKKEQNKNNKRNPQGDKKNSEQSLTVTNTFPIKTKCNLTIQTQLPPE